MGPFLRSVYINTDKWKIRSVFATNPLIKLTNKQITYDVVSFAAVPVPAKASCISTMNGF